MGFPVVIGDLYDKTSTGCDWSWITEERDSRGTSGAVDPALGQPTAGALRQYSPQTVTEGWLRLNPQLLRFELAGPDGTPVVIGGTTLTLTLTVTNMRRIPVTFTPAEIAGELTPVTGAIWYMHFGSLVAAADVSAIRPSAPGWRFAPLHDTRYGSYWAATPDGTAVTLPPGGHLAVELANLAVAAGTRAQAQVYFDYYGLTGIDDGIDVAVLAIRQPTTVLSARVPRCPRFIVGRNGIVGRNCRRAPTLTPLG